jgi:hypothetical protein
MRPIQVSVGPLATASANAICLSQTPTSAFTLNGSLVTSGVAVMDTPRRVLFTTASNESAKTITIVGKDWNSAPITEVITGPNATTGYTNLDFKIITSITISSAAAGAITVGTNVVASSMWVRLDEFAPPMTTVQCIVTGTVNYTVQQSMQDPNSPTNPVNPYQVVFVNSTDIEAVAATTSIFSYFAYSPIFVKVTLNSGSGSVIGIFSQNSAAPY